MRPQALILHANGINRDVETAAALEKAGADPNVYHLNQLRAGIAKMDEFQILVIPGGFSYADALGGGKLMALEMNIYFADQVREFVESGKPVIGICNGFQALVKSGILPGPAGAKGKSKAAPGVRATLTFNQSGRFECRWIYLKPESNKCIWTQELEELVYCPVAHGEGRFLTEDSKDVKNLQQKDQVALTYVLPDGSPARGAYPDNPNGSLADIAGVCNERGNVLGLMPHPEDHIHDWQHPRFARGESGLSGLALYEAGVYYAEEM